MSKDLVIQLYQKQDRKRRRVLFDLFSDTIQLNASLRFIAGLINQELEQEEMVSEADVKYCRYYFSGKATPRPATISSVHRDSKVPVSKKEPGKEISWTDPDDQNFNLNNPVKSKFSKR